MLVKYLQPLGQWLLRSIGGLGGALIMLWQSVSVLPGPRGLQRLVQQLYVVGVQSLIIIIVSAAFSGMVWGLQGYTQLVD